MKADQIHDFDIARKAKATGSGAKTRNRGPTRAQLPQAGSFHSTTHCYTPLNTTFHDQKQNHQGGLDTSINDSSKSANLHFHVGSKAFTSASKTAGRRQVIVYNKSLSSYQAQQVEQDTCCECGGCIYLQLNIPAIRMRLAGKDCSCLQESSLAHLQPLKLFNGNPRDTRHLVDTVKPVVEQPSVRIASFMPYH